MSVDIYISLKIYHVAVYILMGFVWGFSRGVEQVELIYTKGAQLAFMIWSGQSTANLVATQIRTGCPSSPNLSLMAWTSLGSHQSSVHAGSPKNLGCDINKNVQQPQGGWTHQRDTKSVTLSPLFIQLLQKSATHSSDESSYFR